MEDSRKQPSSDGANILLLPGFTCFVTGQQRTAKGIIGNEELDYQTFVISAREVPYQSMCFKQVDGHHLIWADRKENQPERLQAQLAAVCKRNESEQGAYQLICCEDIVKVKDLITKSKACIIVANREFAELIKPKIHNNAKVKALRTLSR